MSDSSKNRIFGSWLSLVVGIFLLVAKFYAYRLTGSQAIFSDALESIVNVTAAAIALFVIYFASQPADRGHPYGHGKMEFFSATFEGGLLTFAGVLVVIESVNSFIGGSEIQQLSTGIYIAGAAGLVNLGLGLYLKQVGKKNHSPALVASGEHIVSDFWTSVAVVGGLVLVQVTGIQWMDPLVALVVGVFLIRTGFKVVLRSSGALLDAEDKDIISKLGELFSVKVFPGIIRIHATKVIRSGDYHHIDAHVVLPEFWSVEEAHEETYRFEADVMSGYSKPGEIHFHIDPCRRAYCEVCDYKKCEVRVKDFRERIPFTTEELTDPEEPPEYR